MDVGEKKAKLPIGKMFLLAILAGVYIGFAAHLASVIAAGGYPGCFGLMLVIIPGSELFTGNNLMTVALCHGRIGFGGLLPRRLGCA